jgi:uncharacterized membrane protein YoaK (UPF0700 family)
MNPDFITVVIGLLTPFVVKLVTDFVKWIIPSVTGMWTLFAVVVISALTTLVSGLVISGSPHWYFQILLGLLAVFVDQLKAQWDASKQ